MDAVTSRENTIAREMTSLYGQHSRRIEVEEGYSGFGYFLASLLWSLGVQAVEKCVGFLFYIIVDILLANKRDNLFKKR